MAEEKKEETTATLKLGDVDVQVFLGMLVHVLQARDEEARSKGDPKLLEMTTAEFIASMVQVFKSQAFNTGVAESAIGDRVLKDWLGVQKVDAVTNPCRIKSAEEAKKFGENMSHTFGPGFQGQLVVVVAVVHPDGSYSAVPPALGLGGP